MKRIHLFEFEDFSWFPNWIRVCMTRMIMVMHRFLKTEDDMAGLTSRVLKASGTNNIIDLCSGSGGPMPEVLNIMAEKHDLQDVQLTLTDLYPNLAAAEKYQNGTNNISYLQTPIDATEVDNSLVGLRTMVSSFHHMRPEQAKKILQSAKESQQPICIFEISDNAFPTFLWWLTIPINMIMSLFVAPFSRPFTLIHFIFTYLIPIIPFFFAWDGAASNARTYTLKDMDVLLEGLHSDGYKWEKGSIKGRGTKLFLIGMPT